MTTAVRAPLVSQLPAPEKRAALERVADRLIAAGIAPGAALRMAHDSLQRVAHDQIRALVAREASASRG